VVGVAVVGFAVVGAAVVGAGVFTANTRSSIETCNSSEQLVHLTRETTRE
jgi:hypothetical protein